MDRYYVAVGICFLLNLIVIIAFRAADRKDKSLKKVNQQVKNFRNEATLVMNRFSDTARDCEQNITARIEYANTVQTHLAESIDMVLVHQKELDDLSGVCENYGNALKRLKTQTEQAENRVYAVQAEVRKTEAVKDYALQFQKDIERLTAQLDSLKADYVRLVASTEQDLKATGARQKEENSESLRQFALLLERNRAQLSEYVSLEKRGYDDMCRQEEEEARARLNALDEKKGELDSYLREVREKLEDFSSSVSASIDSLSVRKDTVMGEVEERVGVMKDDMEKAATALETRRDAVFASMDEKAGEIESGTTKSCLIIQGKAEDAIAAMEKKAEEATEDLDGAIRSTEDTLEKELADKEYEISASLSTFRERLQDNEKAVEEKIASLQESLDHVLEEMRLSFQEQKTQIDVAIRDYVAEKDSIRDELERDITKEKERIEETLRTLSEEKENAVASFRTAVSEEHGNARKTVEGIREERNAVQCEFDIYMEEKRNAFMEQEKRLESERALYVKRCRDDLQDALEELQKDQAAVMEKLKERGDVLLRTIADMMAESSSSQKMLEGTAYAKVKEAEVCLADYSNKIKECESALSDQIEQLTQMKEKVWELQQEEKGLQDELDNLYQDRNKLRKEAEEVRTKRISEEANLVRLKGQQNVLAEKRQEEKKKTGSRLNYEEMEIISEEEVDISDED